MDHAKQFSLCAALLLSGCSPDAGPQAPSSSSPDAAVPVAEDAGKQARCAELAKRFNAVLLASTGECTADGDCASYSAGIGQNCGGATDKASADELRGIAEQFRDELGCDYTVLCAPRLVYGIECRDGRCAEINERR